MALVKKEDLQGKVEVKLSSDIPLPRDRYTARCCKEEAVLAKSSGNLQLVRTWEIVQPDSFVYNGNVVKISGTQVIQYLPVKCFEEKDGKSAADRTASAQDRLFKENAKLGLAQEVDDEQPALECQGVIADVILASDEYVQRKEPTAEQRAAKQMGDPIKDANGKEIKRYTPRFVEVLGRSTLAANQPYA